MLRQAECGFERGLEGDQERFIQETEEIFRLVDERLHMETSRLFPALSAQH